jgi:GDP-L-fucose synthase
MKTGARVYVAGGATPLGAAILDRLRDEGGFDLVGLPNEEPDLSSAGQVEDFFGEARPEYVFFAAGRSGGIGLNQARPAELMLDNLLSTAHVLDAARRHGVRKLLYLASSCGYPRDAPQPLAVESLWAGPVEPTSAAYAHAKLAGWVLCDALRRQYGADFVTAIPANSFGPHDDFGPDSGHVIAALMRRAHKAMLADEPTLTVWGSGTPRREFVYSRDLADACVFVMRRYDGPAPINLGGGAVLGIGEAARAVADVVGYRGRLVFDTTKPDGAPLKALDAAPLRRLGWRPLTEFREALARTYDWFCRGANRTAQEAHPHTIGAHRTHPGLHTGIGLGVLRSQ